MADERWKACEACPKPVICEGWRSCWDREWGQDQARRMQNIPSLRETGMTAPGSQPIYEEASAPIRGHAAAMARHSKSLPWIYRCMDIPLHWRFGFIGFILGCVAGLALIRVLA